MQSRMCEVELINTELRDQLAELKEKLYREIGPAHRLSVKDFGFKPKEPDEKTKP